MKDGKLQIRLSDPVATYVRQAAVASRRTATEYVEAAVLAALAAEPAQSIIGRTIRAVGYRVIRDTGKAVAP